MDKNELDDNPCEDDGDNTCSICGSTDGSPDEDKCPSCRDCGGIYSPGTEECDWCPNEELCGKGVGNEMHQSATTLGLAYLR